MAEVELVPIAQKDRVLAAVEALEFAEAALSDHFASEDGLDPETARRVAWMCSNALARFGIRSLLRLASEMPDS